MNNTHGSIARAAAKGLALFLVLNLLALLLDPVALLGRVTLYNVLLPGRQRLPWGERPDRAYSLTLNSLDAMFASHEISQPKPADEFRVLLIGDSSTWGFLLEPKDTLSGLLNSMDLQRAGKRVRVFNLGYPDFSLSKDLLLLERARHYQPDMIIWLVTLRSFPADAQSHALIEANPQALCLAMATLCVPAVEPLAQRTLFAKRRALADLFRLQLFGLAWAATGIDQQYPSDYTPVQRDLENDRSFRAFAEPALPRDQLAYDVLARGAALAGSVPLLVVNEPMLISSGANSAVRYNFFYPRWAYDRYRADLADELKRSGIALLDLWDLVPQTEFTNSAVHLTPAGSRLLAEELEKKIMTIEHR